MTAMPSMSTFDEINDFLGDRVDMLSQQQKRALSQALKRKYTNGIDMNYLKAVIFPELFTADIPQPLTNLSYCRFTDKQEGVINTGGVAQGTGSGMIVWYPRVTEGPSLFYYKCDANNTLPEGQVGIPLLTGKTVDPAKWKLGFSKSYADNFQQAVLVAASLSIQYIGQVDQESGMMVGGHLYGQGLDNFVVEDIEHSQYYTEARPSEGLRFVYLPMDGPDYDFAPVGYGNSHNAGAHPTGNEQLFNLDTTKTYTQIQGGNFTFNDKDKTATNGQIIYANNTNFVAIYWKGFPTG